MRDFSHQPEHPAQRVFALQRANRWKVALTSPDQRIEKLTKLRASILARRAEILGAIESDFRKAPAESELTEILPVLLEIEDAVKHVRRWMKPRRVSTPIEVAGTRSEIRYEPKGVVLILSPWNYPFQLLISPLVGAIAAGNCAILKPSEKTPTTSAVMKAIVQDAFAEDEVALFEGAADVAEMLLELPFDHIFFTGSTRIGKVVMAAAAKHLSSVTLELGGKSPAIVDEFADPAAAAEGISWCKFINAGQTCVAPDYAFVHRSQVEGFVKALRERVQRSYGDTDEARASTPDFCRMVDAGAFLRVRGLIDDAHRRGAKVELGGQSDEATRYIAPTVLSSVPLDAAIMKEEIFGPVLPVIAFDSLDEVFAHVNRGDKPLALYVFSRRRDRIEAVLRNTSAGGTTVNNTLLHLVNRHLPFGGVGPSGVGAYHGEFGFRAFSHERAVLRQVGRNFSAMFFPPYAGRRIERVLRAMRWWAS